MSLLGQPIPQQYCSNYQHNRKTFHVQWLLPLSRTEGKHRAAFLADRFSGKWLKGTKIHSTGTEIASACECFCSFFMCQEHQTIFLHSVSETYEWFLRAILNSRLINISVVILCLSEADRAVKVAQEKIKLISPRGGHSTWI